MDWEESPLPRNGSPRRSRASSRRTIPVRDNTRLVEVVRSARESGDALDKNKRLRNRATREAEPVTSAPDPIAARNWMLPFGRRLPGGRRSLVAALDTDLEWARAHTRLLGRSLEWEKRDRDLKAFSCAAGTRTRRAMTAARSAGLEPQPTPLQLEYALASRSAATRRQRITVSAAWLRSASPPDRRRPPGCNVARPSSSRGRRARGTALASRQLPHSPRRRSRGSRAEPRPRRRAATTAATDEARDQLRRARRGSRLRSVIDAGEPVRELRLMGRAGSSCGAGEWRRRRLEPSHWSPTHDIALFSPCARSEDLSRDGSKALGVGEGGANRPARVARRAETACNVGQGGPTGPSPPCSARRPTSWCTRALGRRCPSLAGEHLGAPQGELLPRSRRAAPVTGGRVQRRRVPARRGSRLTDRLVWSVPTGSRLFLRSQQDAVQAIAFASGGGQIAAGEIAGVTRVWWLRTGQAVEVRGHRRERSPASPSVLMERHSLR